MNEELEIEDIEELVKDEEPDPVPDESSLKLNSIAYNVAIVVVDAGTGWLLWQLTFWYYGLIWFLAGAVVFFLHQKNFFTPGNNEKQMSGAQTGIIVSVASVVIMAMLAGGLYVFSVHNLWVEVGLIIVSVGLFFYHAYALAMYVFNDDGFRMKNSIARSFAQAEKKVKIAQAGGRVAGAYRKAKLEREMQYRKHGKNNIDSAMNRVEGRKPQQQNRPVQAMASDVQQAELQEKKNPQNPPRVDR